MNIRERSNHPFFTTVSAAQSVVFWGKKVVFSHLLVLRIGAQVPNCHLHLSPQHLKNTSEYPFLASHMKSFMATGPAVSRNLVMIHSSETQPGGLEM